MLTFSQSVVFLQVRSSQWMKGAMPCLEWHKCDYFLWWYSLFTRYSPVLLKYSPQILFSNRYSSYEKSSHPPITPLIKFSLWSIFGRSWICISAASQRVENVLLTAAQTRANKQRCAYSCEQHENIKEIFKTNTQAFIFFHFLRATWKYLMKISKNIKERNLTRANKQRPGAWKY